MSAAVLVLGLGVSVAAIGFAFWCARWARSSAAELAIAAARSQQLETQLVESHHRYADLERAIEQVQLERNRARAIADRAIAAARRANERLVDVDEGALVAVFNDELRELDALYGAAAGSNSATAAGGGDRRGTVFGEIHARDVDSKPPGSS